MIAPQEVIEKIHSVYGRTINEILRKYPQHDIFEILGAIEVLVGFKIGNDITTSPSERMIFAFTWLAREVQNGGFHQYLFNSAGDFWFDVDWGLREIGDTEGVIRFKKVLSLFPNFEPKKDRFLRQEQMSRLSEVDDDALWKQLGDATEEFFVNPYPNWELVFKYVTQHPERFHLE